jgi:hypothetical protein
VPCRWNTIRGARVLPGDQRLCGLPQRIQEAFDDGILWWHLAKIRETPGPKVVDLIEVLSGTRLGFGTLEAAAGSSLRCCWRDHVLGLLASGVIHYPNA